MKKGEKQRSENLSWFTHCSPFNNLLKYLQTQQGPFHFCLMLEQWYSNCVLQNPEVLLTAFCDSKEIFSFVIKSVNMTWIIYIRTFYFSAHLYARLKLRSCQCIVPLITIFINVNKYFVFLNRSLSFKKLHFHFISFCTQEVHFLLLYRDSTRLQTQSHAFHSYYEFEDHCAKRRSQATRCHSTQPAANLK